jgi:hypothetical protein
MEKHLYIIGNGFDIHHDIHSKYYERNGGDCFRKWLDENECDLLCKIDDNFGYQTDEWWGKFEENLASVETLKVAYEEAFEHYPNFGSDDFRDRDWYEAEIATEMRLNGVFSEIQNALSKWVSQLSKGNNTKKIRLLNENSLFLSFNYTHTLEDLYGIPPERILYIHGCLNGESLVFGHGMQYSDLRKIMEKFERVSEGDYVYQTAKESALFSVASHRKVVEDIISKHVKWFERLYDTTNIHIFGHSLGVVDLPYFYKIFDSCDKEKVLVEISCFDDVAKEKAMSLIKTTSIPLSHYKPITLESLQAVKE